MTATRRSLSNRGAQLEDVLATVHGRYHRQGAFVQRNPTPYKVLGSIPGGLRCVPGADAPPDYLVASGGQLLLADAKSTLEGRWALALLEPHQAAAFTRWEEQGPQHRAGVVLWLRAEPRAADCWWVPWSALRPLWERHHAGKAKRGEASLTAATCSAIGVPVKNWDWIAAAADAAPETP